MKRESDLVGLKLDGLVRKVVRLREGVYFFFPFFFSFFLSLSLSFFFFSFRGGGFTFPGVWNSRKLGRFYH